MKTSSHDISSPSRDSNPEPPENETGVTATPPRHSIICEHADEASDAIKADKS